MDLFFCLRDILSDFRHLFNGQNFVLFQAFIFGFITNRGNGTLTELYQSSGSETKYWSFPKFLSRGKWNADAVAGVLIRCLQGRFKEWAYVYDETKALKTGPIAMGSAFFPQLQLSKETSCESIEVSLRTRVGRVRWTLSETHGLAAFSGLGETRGTPDDPR